MDKSILKKLWIKEGSKAVFVNTPPGYISSIKTLPSKSKILEKPVKNSDLIQVFIYSLKDLDKYINDLKKFLSDKGALWITYPAGSMLKDVDINRESIAKYCQGLGLKEISKISIDDKWSAFGFRKT